jgi:ABC-2 type transport system ATP-binding protein
MTQPAALRIEGLRKVYDDGFEALKGIDLTVPQGEFYALLGPNGAGKSTTIGIVCSLVRKTAGKVWINGIDIDENFAEAKRNVGIVPQEFNFSLFEKVRDIVLNSAGYQGLTRAECSDRADYYLDRLGLYDKRNTQSRGLSGGMKRRLMIARALVHDPKLLILDEPTAGVDIQLRRGMMDFLSELNEEQGTTIILTTHYLEEAEALCRRVAIINQGDIVEDTDTRSLLSQLNTVTFVMDLAAPLAAVPTLPGYEVQQSDDMQLEVTLQKGQELNDVFAQLTQSGVGVVSMRTKSNRLEELFINLTGQPTEVSA